MTKDEALGFGTWIYSENRAREHHEYFNYWKEEKREREVLMENYLSPDSTIESLIEEIKDLRTQLIRERSKKENYTVIAERVQRELEDKTKELLAANATLERKSKEHLAAINALQEYGDHDPDCYWLEVASCGRILPGKEEDHCTCGWYSATKDLLGSRQ